jgi:hypothetical protein
VVFSRTGASANAQEIELLDLRRRAQNDRMQADGARGDRERPSVEAVAADKSEGRIAGFRL